MNLAYYTCFFGGENNYSYLIPPIPSECYDCYYFTNNPNIYDQLETTKFIRIFVDIPITNNDIIDTFFSKKYRCLPFDLEILQKYEYVCWFDNKLKVFSDKVEKLIQDSNKSLVFTKHPYYEKYNSIWDEFDLSMNYDKYKNQEEQYRKYINSKPNNTLKIFLCGGFNIRKNDEISKKFGLEWYNNILDCGIQDQISLHFVIQNYTNHLFESEYGELWNYFF